MHRRVLDSFLHSCIETTHPDYWTVCFTWNQDGFYDMLNLRFQRINLKAELELPAGDNCRFYELLEV